MSKEDPTPYECVCIEVPVGGECMYYLSFSHSVSDRRAKQDSHSNDTTNKVPISFVAIVCACVRLLTSSFHLICTSSFHLICLCLVLRSKPESKWIVLWICLLINIIITPCDKRVGGVPRLTIRFRHMLASTKITFPTWTEATSAPAFYGTSLTSR